MSFLAKTIGFSALGLGASAATVGGSLGGAYLSAQSSGDAQTGAIVGGAVGAGAAAGAFFGVKGIMGIPEWLGKEKTRIGFAKAGANIANFSKNFATNTFPNKILPALKKGAIQRGKAALSNGASVANLGLGTALKAGAKYGNLATSLFTSDPTGRRLFKTSAFGKAAIGAGFAVSGVASAVSAFNDARRGQSDGQITYATPHAPVGSSEMRNAGATGDLAFAMRNLRYGG